MGRISDTLSVSGKKALIAYVMAGYPDNQSTISAVRGLVKGGADIIEMGFPFSDPLADGPAIQEAADVSLGNGMDISSYYDMVSRIRAFTDVPLVTMTYSNIAYSMGYEAFASGAATNGVDGIILPDMPPEESHSYVESARRHGVDTIFLVSPNTQTERVARIARITTGFLYMVAVYGTTGARTGVQDYAVRALDRIKSVTGNIPVGIGFGISGAQDARRYVDAGADAVIVGSAILNVMEKSRFDDMESNVESFVRALKTGMT